MPFFLPYLYCTALGAALLFWGFNNGLGVIGALLLAPGSRSSSGAKAATPFHGKETNERQGGKSRGKLSQMMQPPILRNRHVRIAALTGNPRGHLLLCFASFRRQPLFFPSNSARGWKRLHCWQNRDRTPSMSMLKAL